MAFNIGGIGSAVVGWASSLIFWGAVILAMGILFIVILKVKQNRRYEFPCLEFIGLGQGKVRVNISQCGWFKKNRIFFGLIERGGEDVLLCKDGKRKIYFASSSDYHDIDGVKGIICKRKDDDPEVLVPLSKFLLDEKSKTSIMSVVPADYRDIGIQILEDKRKETMTWWDENKATILSLTVIVFAIIALIIVFQFAKGESSEWRAAGQAMMSSINTVRSNTP